MLFQTDSYDDFKTAVAEYGVSGKLFYWDGDASMDGRIVLRGSGGNLVKSSVKAGVPSFAAVQTDFPNVIQLSSNFDIL